MSTITNRPDPRTLASIEAQGLDDRQPNVPIYRCGCHERPPGSEHWWLCDYHEGYDDALDILDDDEYEPDVEDEDVPEGITLPVLDFPATFGERQA